MSKGMSAQERVVRIELARARAALERQEVARSLHQVRRSMTLSGIWHSIAGHHGQSPAHAGSHNSWLSRIMTLSRRYPYIVSSVSALLGTIGRRRRGATWRLGLAVLGAWRLARKFKKIVPEGAPPRRLR